MLKQCMYLKYLKLKFMNLHNRKLSNKNMKYDDGDFKNIVKLKSLIKFKIVYLYYATKIL